MRIHEDVELILFRNPENFDCKCNPLIVICSGTSMLDSFPGEDVTNRVVAQPPKSPKVQAGILQREWSSKKRDIVCVKKLVGNVGWNVWGLGVFGVARDVDPSQDDLSVLR